MKKRSFLILFLVAVAISAGSQSRSYYISPYGDDSHSGLSIDSAWRSINKINQTDFLPGDAILFESGGVWMGQLEPGGSGEPGKPIRISSYGGSRKPVIHTGDAEGAGIRLTNQSWWEISNMEVTSGAQAEPGIGRQGIVALVKGEGNHVEHIVIRDCYIHDIWGQLGGNTEYTGYNSCAILVGLPMSRERIEDFSLNEVLIENNRIERVDKCGIIVNRGKNNIVVRKNEMKNHGGDGIIVLGAYRGLIEYNKADRTCLRTGDPDLPGGEEWWPHTAAIWLAACTETIMQFNEVYNTGRQPANGDGFAYDFDFNCRNCILQYNYSANGHGLLLIMNRAYNNIARYNISHNDQTHLIQIHGNTEDGNIIHNNLFYVDHSTVDLDFYCGMENEKDKTKLGVTFMNNIFYAAGQGRFRTVYTHGSSLDRSFNDSLRIAAPDGGPKFINNCYFGPWLKGVPDDPQKLIADPMFVAPGTAGSGLVSLKGYQLKPGSPCIDAGEHVEINYRRDFFGNHLIDNRIDIGIFEYKGPGI